MADRPIIGGNWNTTEPRFRKPQYRPDKGKLHILTNTELDTLDALSMLGRASSVKDVFQLLKFAYKDESAIRKCLERMAKLGCIDCVEMGFQFPGPGQVPIFYRSNQIGMDAMNECLEFLIEKMIERGDDGIRRY